MAINLKFDLMGNPEPPTVVLANRNGNKLGQLNVNVDSIDVKDALKLSEFSFTLNKYIDGEPTPLWNKVVDFKLVNCPEWDLWFEIKVELDEATETVKTVYCTQLGQAELSQIKVYDIHINEEGDPNWDTNNETYKSTILCDKEHTDVSLLHRLLKDKAPHYSIDHVDESIQRIQRQFSFDDTSICDAFDEISEEIGCLFVYNSNSTKGGKPNRSISVYDLQQNCNNKSCKHRGEFTDKCPKCGSTDITYGYGEDTTIFVTSDELATEGIQLVTDTDSVKNCFKLEGGDDLMTATIRNCNPNGSDYIWYFSDALKEDMSKELVDKLESYDEKYQEYYNNHISELNVDIVKQYNRLVEVFDDDGKLVSGYSRFYDAKSTCLNCAYEDYFENQCPKCNSKNILTGQKLQTTPTTIKGYPDLMTTYYNTIDLLLYLESGLMPNVEMSGTTAEEQVKLLTSSSLSPVAVNVKNVKEVKNISEATAKSAVLSMAKVLIKSTYKVDVVDGSSSLEETVYIDDVIGEYKKWTGKFKVTNLSDEEDSATSEIIEVFVGNDVKTFIKRKIDKELNKENTDDYSITGLFAKDLNVDENGEHIIDENGVCQGAETFDENGEPLCPFCAELKKYALNPLDNFSKVSDTCLSILHEQGVGDDGSDEDDEIEREKKKVLYNELYKPYYDKQQAINNEMAIRENEVAIIEGVWDKSDENNPKCTTWGLQQYIEKCQQDIQKELDFKKHLGEDLWLEFCAYRREDKYSNSNYVSDGLNNAELFNRANEFIEVAEEEIFKSAELQHSISATLNNLLSLPKFKPLLNSFKTGNWIRVQVDDKVYKLRLLEYNFGYGNSDTIAVEFSDVTKIKNGTTDLQDIFSQASSMASSYDSVQRQAQKADVARGTIDQWLVDGLNGANVQIKSNDSEEILLTKNGLLARSYDDITGTYEPEQFKLTHNIMAYTTDNWETVSAALGKHEYQKWKDNQWATDTDYGLSSKFVTAGYVTGSQIIGGEIVSSNYKLGDEPKGTYINLIKGDFEFAGGKIVYNSQKNQVTLSGVTIQWDNVNKPTIENIDGMSGITEDIRAIEQGLQATTINDQYVISPNIVGGYLNIKNNNNVGVVIDPNEDYIFQVYNSDGTTTVGVDKDGNAEFSGTITGSDIIGNNSLFIGETIKNNGTYAKNYEKDYAEITEDGELICTNVHIKGGVFKASDKEDGSVHTWISEDGVLNTNFANINGAVNAASGSIGGFTIEPVKDENGDTIGGWLYSSGKTLGEDESIFLSATDMSGTIPFSQLIARTDANGDIVADENGDVIYDITTSNLFKEDWRMTIGRNFGVTSDGTVYMSNCEIVGGSLRMGTESDGYHTWISEDGVLNAWGANIDGKITAIEGSIGKCTIGIDGSITSANGNFSVDAQGNLKAVGNGNIGGFTIGDTSVYHTKTSYNDASNDGVYLGTDGIGLGKGKFSVDALGNLIADNAHISGGKIGGWTINRDALTNYGGTKDADGYYPNSFCMQIRTETNGAVNALAIGKCSEATWGNAAFRVTTTGEMYASNGRIGVCNFYNTQYPVVGEDLINPTGYVVKDRSIYKYYIEYPVRLYPCSSLSVKTIDAFEYVDAGNYGEADGYHWYYAWTNSATSLPSNSEWISAISFSSMDTSVIETKAHLWLRCYLTRREGDGYMDVEIDIGTASFYIGDYSGYLTTFSFGDDSLRIGEKIISGKASNIQFADTYGRLTGTWYVGDGDAAVTSWRGAKSNIASLDDRYSILFDGLRPVRFTYNNGQSNRYHTGFILDELKSAMDEADVDTSELAAYCVSDEATGEGGIRYSELVSLCVDQIQKLKRRVEELENK